MNHPHQLHEIGRLPLPDDNVVIATRRLDAGTEIIYADQTFVLDYTILEGHRFAIQPIAAGQNLLSWGLRFGIATQDIDPGTYVSNEGMLEALRGRSIDFALPDSPNFEDIIEPYTFSEAAFQPAEQLSLYPQTRTFFGYRRSEQRGVGTRNDIVLLGTTSRTGSYVKQLEAQLKNLNQDYDNLDDIMAVAHTEGGNDGIPNNLDPLLRTLAGFVIHPNVGAVLAVDYGTEAVTNEMLHNYMVQNNYPLHDVPHHFLSLSDNFPASLAQGETIVKDWLEAVKQTSRTAESLSNLKIALQCGGSDAFSGISGNPLASWVVREVIRYGGAANLAETDELIGAESYVLQKIGDVATAHKFLDTMERFKERAAWHGHTAEGNPSGGNKFRGLYNITLKSIGAAMKRHPDVRLDYVIDYSELMPAPGYYFMDSPGNDLESIAGQVAAGCNMIFFVTGNGSITNFPFVPTLKIVTTSARYDLLSNDMDVNAGAYLDGTAMDDLGADMLDLTLKVASGQRSVGEQAGHAQVQIWRDWPQTNGSQVEQILKRPHPTGTSLSIKTNGLAIDAQYEAFHNEAGYVTDQIGLIMPTSLCAGQIARMTADDLNRKKLGRAQLSRFVSLTHTEGCGVSSGSSEALYIRTMLSYISHPLVKHCIFLEHGCEKTHNDFMRHRIEDLGLNADHFGWASIQLDGGINKVSQKIEDWFRQAIAQTEEPKFEKVGLGNLRLGLLTAGPTAAEVIPLFTQLTQTVVGAGGTVVVPQHTSLLVNPFYVDHLFDTPPKQASLAYGDRAIQSGFHIMETPTNHWVETLTGLGATGVEIILTHVGEHPMQAHPLIPLLQMTAHDKVRGRYESDMDLVLDANPSHWLEQVVNLITASASRTYVPKLYQQGNIDFQLTRGLLGLSL